MNAPDPTDPPWLQSFRKFAPVETLQVELKTSITLPGKLIREVSGIFMRFPKWTGDPFTDDFGKKSSGMIDLDGEHLFPELAVLRVLERDGWTGRWVNTWSAKGEIWKYLTDWRDVPRAEQKNRPIEDAEPRQLLARIATINKPARYGGCWDTVAWKGSDFVFLQCKKTPPKVKDMLRTEQEDWLRSALYLGDPRVRLSSFCVVEWEYE